MVWLGMLIGGACAGHRRAWAKSPDRSASCCRSVSPGYGFAAIIVAFVGRLHPVGILLASLLMSLLYLGGEAAQMGLTLPSAITGLFQGMLLFFLLGSDVFINYRVRVVRPVRGTGRASRCPPETETPMDHIVPILAAAIAAGTPLVFAALGELVTEKSGVLNLGVEGMMLVGAIAGFATAATTGSLWLGVLAGMAAGAAMSLIFAVLTLTLMANQVASGLALSLFGVGLSAFVGKPFESVVARQADRRSRFRCCRTSRSSDRLLFKQHPLVYVTLAAVRRRRPGSCTAAAPGSCCARSASRRTPRTRSAIR